jgi:hypothetical protein
MTQPSLVLLGPQRERPTVGAVVADLGLRGPYALITAGWQEREGEDAELRAAIGGASTNLEVYKNTVRVARSDPELKLVLRWRQDRLMLQQRIYRVRLAKALAAARTLLRMAETLDDEHGHTIELEARDAIDAVRQLDAHHLERIALVHREYDERLAAHEHAELERTRERLRAQIDETEAVLIAGGHVAVLLNRLQLFGLADVLRGKLLIAWSAGAMALGERVVLFHDFPPEGAGNAEVLERGLGVYRGLLAFPRAEQRLALDEALRVRLLSRRFEDAACVPLDFGDRLDWHPPRWQPAPGARVFHDGAVVTWEGR